MLVSRQLWVWKETVLAQEVLISAPKTGQADVSVRFLGAYTNKIDAKGRLSTPADYRRALETGLVSGVGEMICYPSFTDPVLECGGTDLVTTLMGMVANYDVFDEQREALEISILSEAQRLSFDENGRIVLPPALREFAGLSGQATFVGLGNRFQIWHPTAYQEKVHRARAVMAAHRDVLKARGLPSLAGQTSSNGRGGLHE